MSPSLFSWVFSPLQLAAARRLIPSATVEPTGEDSLPNRISVFFSLSPDSPRITISLWSTPEGLLSTCPLCETKGEPPCRHAIATIEILRVNFSKTPPPSGSPPLSPSISVTRRQTSLPTSGLRITRLVLAGRRDAPLFVALTGTGAPLSAQEFDHLGAMKRSGDTLPSETSLFLDAFLPFSSFVDGNHLQGYRPRAGGSASLFELVRAGLPILSARTRTPYRLDLPSHAPRPRVKGRWISEPGGEMGLEFLIESRDEILSPKDYLYFSFGEIAILCGRGQLQFFPQSHHWTASTQRLVDNCREERPLPPSEWMPLLDPERGGTAISSLFTFSPPEQQPVYTPGRSARPLLVLEGRPGGIVEICPKVHYSDSVFVPLFGPDRHRLGDYLPEPDGEGVRLIARDREKELFFRNTFERIARLSHSGSSLPIERQDVASLIDKTLPALEEAGFEIDRAGLFGEDIIAGPVSLSLILSTSSEDRVSLEARIETPQGSFPLPGRGKGEEDSPLLFLTGGLAAYLEGPERLFEKEIRQLFSLNGNGQGEASRYYVSMLHLLRPDLPFAPAPGLTLSPFAPAPLPAEAFEQLSTVFAAHLRPYQKEAVSFLVSLFREKLSGILADEMGLGKTISVLGFLLTLRISGLIPADCRPPLIVLPASLLYNWAHEIARFSPELVLHIHAGSDRKRRLEESSPPDLILTTYGTLRNDPDLSLGPDFACMVMDEAHQVKNPDSLTHKALAQIPARHKIAVTGTPVENRLSDLWGLFALLMPGLLGSRAQFERRFLREDAGEEERNRRISLLKNLVSPLILRRTKAMVLTDLPPKVEVEIWVDPTEEEELHIHTLKREARQELERMGESGDGPLRMAYLTLLLRLRQQACHPLLLPPELRGARDSSSKFTLVTDKISEGVEEGHKILLFSQFTGILDLFEARLPELGITTVRLDGSTPIVERQRRVKLFQSDSPDSPKVFLASLKAGGVGLTLTKADYVFHYDPWWNPQVEAQASDRSHRIGQTRSVFIYRFLVRGTVEERVQDLKNSKRALFTRLLDGEGPEPGGDSTFTLEEMRSLIDFG